MTEYITGAMFKTMIINSAASVENHSVELNGLNVFPVPDGDTGTNMALTLSRSVKALAADNSAAIGKVAEVASKGFVNGARGNSGVILSQLFRGLAERLRDFDTADALTFAAALVAGVERAYNAVMKPTEGTILTVSRHAAHAAEARAEQTADIEDVLEAALESARVALANTINQNPVLKKAGVIDSGGKGYVYILDAMLRALRGEIIIPAESAGEQRETASFAAFNPEDIKFTYCTEFTVAYTSGRDVNALRVFLDAHGDSVVVLDDEEIIKVHVHTNEPGIVLTEALTFGSLLAVKVENMREQHTEMIAATAAKQPEPAAPVKKYGMAVVCAGSGMAAVFRDLGADRIITGGQTMNPSTEEILAQIEATPSEIVFVFPNNKNIIWAAQECIPLSTKTVVVIPSRSMPQGVCAMLAYEESLDEDELTAAMNEALSGVRTVQITHASRDSSFDGHDIKAGQYLALVEDALTAFGAEFAPVATAVSDALTEKTPEFITVFTGEDAVDSETETLTSRLQASFPNAELTVVPGNQPVYRYVVSVE